jgi:hypothetical protein
VPLLQYQIKAEPVYVPAAAPAITVDAWQPQLTQPQHPPPSIASTVLLTPVFVPPAVTVDQWLYPVQVPVRLPARAAVGEFSLPLGSLVTPGPDQWVYQAPLFPFTRAQAPAHQAGVSNVEPIAAPAVPAPSFDWFQVQPDMVRRMQPPMTWVVMFAGPSMVITYASGTEPVLVSRRVVGVSGRRVLD